MQLDPVRLAETRHETPHEALFRFEDTQDAWLEAYTHPGMKAWIHAGDAKALVGLASRPRRRPVEVLLETGSELAQALLAGKTPKLGQPFGFPVPIFDHRGKHLYLIGRGAGLGPVRATVLHAMIERGAFQSVQVLAEATYTDEIPFHDEIPAWQRAGLTVHQVLSRADAAKWRSGEDTYVYEFLGHLPVDAEASVFFVAGPVDLCQGVLAALRKLEVPPDQVFVFEHTASRRQHRDAVERPADLLAKITDEGIWGSGHQNDAADHPPVVARPAEQPAPTGMPRYKQIAGKA